MEWDTNKAWRKQIERRVYELAALVKGMMPAQADRVNDMVDQLDELRQELKRVSDKADKIDQVSDKLDKVAEYVKANVPKKGKNGE